MELPEEIYYTLTLSSSFYRIFENQTNYMKLLLSLILISCNAIVFSQVVPPLPVERNEEIETPEIIDFPDEEASFPGGVEALSKYIEDNAVYPEAAKKEGIQEKIYVQFIVKSDGSLTGIEIISGKNIDLRNETIRLVSEMPLWIPAEKDSEQVASRVRLPINYTLPKKSTKKVRKNQK